MALVERGGSVTKGKRGKTLLNPKIDASPKMEIRPRNQVHTKTKTTLNKFDYALPSLCPFYYMN